MNLSKWMHLIWVLIAVLLTVSACENPSSDDNSLPNTPRNPSPSNGAIDVDPDTPLTWEGGDPDGDQVTYSIYHGTTNPPPILQTRLTQPSYLPEREPDQHVYFWKVVSNDTEKNTRVGPIWSYTTSSAYSGQQLASAISNFGNFGDPNLNIASMEYPEGSGVYYLWEGRFWVGGVTSDGLRHVTHATYGHYEWKPSPEQQGGDRPAETYTLLNGDNNEYSCVYDDLDEDVADHTSLGLQIEQTVQSFPIGTGPSDAMLITQVISNIGINSLDSVYVAWVFDFDVAAGPNGDQTRPNVDDLMGFDLDLQMGYMFDGDDPDVDGDDTGEGGLCTGYAGIALIDAPQDLAAILWWDWSEDPRTDSEKFGFISGTHPALNGEAFRTPPTSVLDYRVILSTGPYSLIPGSTMSVVATLAVGEGLEGLTRSIEEVRYYYSHS